MLPLATTTITVKRVPADTDRDAYDEKPAEITAHSGIPAHFSSPSGREIMRGGSQEVIDRHLDCEIIDLKHTDHVIDEQTDERYQIVWAHKRMGLGLDRIEAGVKRVEGRA